MKRDARERSSLSGSKKEKKNTSMYRSTYRDKKQREDMIAMNQKKQRIIEARERIQVHEREFDALNQSHTTEVAKTLALEEEVKALSEDLKLLRTQVGELNRKPQEEPMLKKLKTLEAQLRVQRLREQESQERCYDASQKLNGTAHDLHVMSAQEADIDAFFEKRILETKEIASTRKALRKKRENDRAKARSRAFKKQQMKMDSITNNLFDRSTVDHQAKVRTRLAKDLREAKQFADMQDNAHLDAMRRRTDNVISLKASTDASRANIIGAQERRKKREARARSRREAERAELAKTNRNPEAILRAREAATESTGQREEIERRIHKQKMELLDRLHEEHRRDRVASGVVFSKKEQRERLARGCVARNKEDRVRYTKSLMPDKRQNFLDHYMKSQTLAGTDLIDVSGTKGPIYGSKVMPVKQKSFGLGRANIEAIKREQILYPDVTYNESLLNVPDIEKQPRFGRTMAEPSLDSSDEDNDGDESKQKKQHDVEARRPPTALDLDSALSGGRGKPPVKIFKAPVLDKYMERKLREVRAEREALLRKGVEKKILGKTYKGSKFLCQPEIVEFKDFIVGKKRRKRVVLTNVSFTFNSFRVEGIEMKYQDLFEVNYKPPGRMSAGLTATIEIVFLPEQNLDIITYLALITETGPLRIPIECRTRKVDIAVPSPHLELGALACGETLHRTITIVNRGALPIDFETIFDEDMGEALGSATLEDAQKAISFAGSPTRIGGYSSRKIHITFKPEKAGSFDLVARVVFGRQIKCCDQGFPIDWGSPREFPLRITGRADEVPVYVERESLDLQTCVLGKLYRTKLVLRNRSNNSQKVSLKAPRPLSSVIKFTPRDGYVQTDVPLVVSVQFVPTASFERKLLVKDYYDGEQRALDIGLTVDVPGQTLPVEYRIKAQFTTSALLFESGDDKEHGSEGKGIDNESDLVLDFGRCYTSHTVAKTIRITNNSSILQRAGFVELPSVAQILPTAFMAILPGQTVTRHILFRPIAVAEYNIKLFCRANLGDTYTIHCRGKGAKPSLSFLHSNLKLAATADGHREQVHTYLTSEVDIPMAFNFGIKNNPYLEGNIPGTPEAWQNSFLSISPASGVIKPRGTVRVQIDFHPEVRVESYLRELGLAPKLKESVVGAGDGESKEGGEETNEGGDDGEDEAAASAAATAEVKGDEKDADASLPKNPEDDENPDAAVQLMLKDIVTFSSSAFPKTIIKVPGKEEEEEEEEKGVGEVKSEDIAADSNLDAAADDEKTKDSAQKQLEPWSRHARTLISLFAAPEEHVLAARSSASGKLSVAPEQHYLSISTTVVEPKLRVAPRCIHFGQVVCGQKAVQMLQLSNTSDREMSVRLRPLGASSPFRVLNAPRKLAAGSKRTLLVEFQSSVERRFVEVLNLSADDCALSIGLVGQGVTSELEIKYSTVEQRFLHAGDILCGDSRVEPITVTNKSEFPFSFNLGRRSEPFDPCEKGESGLAEFNFVPKAGRIQPGETLEIKCSFQADRPSLDYKTTLLIGRYTVPVRGRCHSDQLFFIPPPSPKKLAPPHPVEQIVEEGKPDPATTHVDPFAFLDSLGAEDEAKGGEEKKGEEESLARDPVVLELRPKRAKVKRELKQRSSRTSTPPASAKEAGDIKEEDWRPDDGKYRAKVIVGSCLTQDKSKSSSGSYEFTFAEDSKDKEAVIAIEPSSKSIEPGKVQEVIFTFDPEKYEEQLREKADDGLPSTGSLKVNIKCKLKGGYRKDGAGEQELNLCLLANIDR